MKYMYTKFNKIYIKYSGDLNFIYFFLYVKIWFIKHIKIITYFTRTFEKYKFILKQNSNL